MRFLCNFDATTVRRQHPDWNLQSPTGGVNDGDCSISPLRSTQDLKSSATERMKRVKDPDVRTFCAQGIVSVVTFIPTFTA